MIDTAAFGVSVIGAILEFAAAASMNPIAVGEAVLVYESTLGRVETVLGVTGFVNTAVADWAGGYTYLDFEALPGPELVIGQDTTREVLANLVSALPSATVDTVVNTVQAHYSWTSLTEDPTWELRIPLTPWSRRPHRRSYGMEDER